MRSFMRNTAMGAMGLLVALTVSACAGRAQAPGTPSGRTVESIPITVEHDLARNVTLSLRLVSSSGRTQLLGTLTPGRTREFAYEGVLEGSLYRLFAYDGSYLVHSSIEFAITKGSTVVWQLDRNVIAIGGGERAFQN